MPADTDFIVTAKRRFVAAKSYWSTIREDFRADIRYVCGDPEKQWAEDKLNDRKAQELPALTFDRCNPRVQAIVNKARRDRPEPQVTPGDDGDPEVAELIEGKVRHILYASQASIPFDNATMYAASGGFGIYRLVMEWVQKTPRPGSQSMWIQEPRVKGILDPLNALYMDPGAVEPDFSDAKWWFVRERIRRESFKDRFGQEPKPFDNDDSQDWGDDEENVWVAEYHLIEEGSKKYVQLHNGEEGYLEEFAGVKDEHIANSRDIPHRTVTCHLMDGEKVLEKTDWPGDWIPIFVVKGEEIVSDGKRRWKSAIRYTRGPQNFLNGAMSEVAISLGTANLNGWTGPEGSFKDGKWRSNKRELYREWRPVHDENGALLPAPARDNWTPPLQHLVQSVSLAADALQATMGYTDRILRPSQSDLSGAAVERREEQTDAANTQYKDNLVASQWHLGRCLVDLIMKTTDTPRMMTSRAEDGKHKTVPITVPDENGQLQFVPGQEGQMHYRLDVGEYGVVVSSGKSYDTKIEEEADRLMELYSANPVLCLQLFGDILFEKLGYRDLAERAKLGLAPPIQQAIQQQDNPQDMKAQLTQLMAQNQQMRALIQQVIPLLQTKQIEAQGKIELEKAKGAREVTVEKLKLAGDLVRQHGEQAHDHHIASMGHAMDAVNRLTELLHESELSPDPNAPQPTGAPA